MEKDRKTFEKELFDKYISEGCWRKETQFDRLAAQAERLPDKLAVTDDERSLTFSELLDRSKSYAAYLLSLGLKKGDVVIVQHFNAVSFVEMLYACYAAGLLIHPMLMSYRETEITGVIKKLRPSLYISAEDYMGFDHAELAKKCIAESDPQLKLLTVSEFEKIDLSRYDLDAVTYESPVFTDSSIIVSSSGSTGIPKLIERTHANYIHCQMTCAKSIDMTENDIEFIPMPLMHCWNLCDPGLVGSLSEGCTVVLSKYNTPDEIMRLIDKYKVTVVALVPALVQACIEYRKYDESEDISSLRVIQAGGSICSPELVSAAMDSLGCVVQQIYGMSEGFVSATKLCDELETIVTTQGYPVSEWSEIRLVDADGNEVPDGEAGELLVRGPSVVTEYYMDPEANARSFTDDLFYCTGDEAVLVKNGRIRILGRVVELINRCGEKITPSEVEEMLMKIDTVKEAAVVGKKDPSLGQRICAYVTAEDNSLDLAAVRKILSEMGLASFKLPDRFEILKEMPRTGVNKINKKLLSQKEDRV